MSRMIKRMIAGIMAVILLTSVVSVCFAAEGKDNKSIDVWAKSTEEGYANVYTVEVSIFDSGLVQAGGFGFQFSSNQVLSSTELRIHQITSNTEGYSWFRGCMSGLGGSVAPFEIYSVENGKKTELTHDIQATVTFPSTYKQPKLYLLDTNGNAKNITLSKSGSDYTFTISENGYYVFVEGTSTRGDINFDGRVTNADVIALARYLVNLVELSEEQLIQADYNESGEITNADLIRLARSIVGM